MTEPIRNGNGVKWGKELFLGVVLLAMGGLFTMALQGAKSDINASIAVYRKQIEMLEAQAIEGIRKDEESSKERSEMQQKFVEIETQFRALGNDMNLLAQEHDRILSVLWQKEYGTPYPHRLFYPAHGRGNTGP